MLVYQGTALALGGQATVQSPPMGQLSALSPIGFQSEGLEFTTNEGGGFYTRCGLARFLVLARFIITKKLGSGVGTVSGRMAEEGVQ